MQWATLEVSIPSKEYMPQVYFSVTDKKPGGLEVVLGRWVLSVSLTRQSMGEYGNYTDLSYKKETGLFFRFLICFPVCRMLPSAFRLG